jgi:hypothetical protein
MFHRAGLYGEARALESSQLMVYFAEGRIISVEPMSGGPGDDGGGLEPGPAPRGGFA